MIRRVGESPSYGGGSYQDVARQGTLETAVDKMTNIMETLASRDLSQPVAIKGYDPDDDRRTDKLNALTGLD